MLGGLIGLVSAIFGFLGLLLIMSLSRNREFAADRTGAEITGDPLGLASALETLEDSSQTIENNEKQIEIPPRAAHLLIHDPSKRLFSTHPSMERRIARLRSMAESSILS